MALTSLQHRIRAIFSTRRTIPGLERIAVKAFAVVVMGAVTVGVIRAIMAGVDVAE